MKNLFVFACLLLVLSSCITKTNNQKGTNIPADTDKTEKLCFIDVTQSKENPVIKDTMSLTINKAGNAVTGTYKWLPYEKDKKTGTYKGTLNDNIVTAVYTYDAEGQTVKEELVFKIADNAVHIKTGELEEVNSIWKLKNKDTAQYTTKLAKTECN